MCCATAGGRSSARSSLDTHSKCATIDVLRHSRRALFDALCDAVIAGESDPGKLLRLCCGRLEPNSKVLIEVLRRRVTDHHRFLVELRLAQLDLPNPGMRDVEARMGKALVFI